MKILKDLCRIMEDSQQDIKLNTLCNILEYIEELEKEYMVAIDCLEEIINKQDDEIEELGEDIKVLNNKLNSKITFRDC